MARRHADVDDREVWFLLLDEVEQRGAVVRLPHDVEAGAGEEACHSFAKQDVVVRNDDTRRGRGVRHGAIIEDRVGIPTSTNAKVRTRERAGYAAGWLATVRFEGEQWLSLEPAAPQCWG